MAKTTLTVTEKGAVTLGADLLKHLGIRPGEKVAVEKFPGGRLELKSPGLPGKTSDVFGFLKRDGGPSLSVEDVNEIAAQGWAGER
jgi:bifunctional DNA-binding transcriptional regulator/antitoxin component of YhaV-PrlF toxin-antitoxin module